jgi:hypothetical protein
VFGILNSLKISVQDEEVTILEIEEMFQTLQEKLAIWGG